MLSRRGVIGAGLALAASVRGGARAASQPAPLVLRRGINMFPWFSLTREFPAPRTDYPPEPFATGRPVPTPADLAVLRRTGLDFIRIPVDPGPFLAAAPGPRAALLDTLMAAVAQGLAADLNVVVNLQANAATHFWTPGRLYGGADAPAFAAYAALVGTVAGLLGRLDPARVALEPVNEPPQACASTTWSALQSTLLATARAAAPRLTLLATGSCGSMIAGLLDLDPVPLLRFAPLLFTFHFYEPYLFSHQGAPWMREPVYKALNAVPWPGAAGTLDRTLAAVRLRLAQDALTPPAAKQAAYAETERVLKVYFDAQPGRPFIDGYLGMARSWCTRNGIAPARVVMGEFGALRSDARYVAAGRDDRIRYIRDVRLSAEAFGFPWAMWALFDGMGMMDDVTRALDPAIVGALGLAMA